MQIQSQATDSVNKKIMFEKTLKQTWNLTKKFESDFWGIIDLKHETQKEDMQNEN